MKRLLAFALALAFAVVAHAAPGKGTGLSSPVMTNFNARDFLVTLAPGTAPTNIIQLKWGEPHSGENNISEIVINVFSNYFGTNIINPTDNYLPVRSNATTFVDSPLYRVALTNIATDGQIIFGPGTTNVLYRTNGTDVAYANGTRSATFTMDTITGITSLDLKSGANVARYALSPGGHVEIIADAGKNVYLGPNAANAASLLVSDPTGFFPNTVPNTLTLGTQTYPWFSASLTNSLRLGTNTLSYTGTDLTWNGTTMALSTNAGNWVASGTTNSTLTGDAFVNSLLPTNGLQSVSGASATYIGGADIWNMGVNSSSASAIYNNCYSFYNFGTNSAHGIKATNSYSIFNFSLDGLEDAVLDGVANLFGFGADVFWQANISSSSYNLFGHGAAAGESTTISNSHDLYFDGSSAGLGGSFLNSLQMYMFGNRAGYSMSASASSEIYAFGGLDNATLNNTKNLLTLGHGAGDGINGAYTNVVLIGDGATIGATGENQIIAGPNMSMSVSNATLAGTAFFGASARTNWVDQVNIASPMVSSWITDNGDPSRMQPYWQVSKDGVWNKMAATFYIDLATNFLHFGGTADNGNTNGPWFSFNAKNDQAYTVLDLGCSENESFFMLDPYTITRPNFWFTVRTNNTSDTILAITNLTTKVLGLKTNGDLSLPGTLSANAAVLTNALTLPAGTKSAVSLNAGTANTGLYMPSGGFGWSIGGTAFFDARDANGGFCVHSAWPISWGSTTADSTADVKLYREAPNTLNLRNGTAAQTFHVSNTWSNNGVDYERGVLDWITTPNSFTIGTEMGGTGSSRAVQFRQGGTNVFYIGAATGALLWNTDNSRDIGASGATRPKNIFAAGSLNAGTQVVIAGTTNQVIFGSTNTAPVSSAAPTKWISVQVSGETNIYRLPLYE